MTFNPVCRELGAPPAIHTGSARCGRLLSIPFAGSWGLRPLEVVGLTEPGPFNPVCRELGAPPEGVSREALAFIGFQSRLPGVGGSASLEGIR